MTKRGALSWKARLTPWLLPVALLSTWYLLSRTGRLPDKILPSPPSVVHAAWKLLRSGDLWRHVTVSTLRAFTGLAVGGSIGLTLGFLTGLSRTANRLLDNSIQMVRTIPNLALIPLVIVWFGIGEEAKIFLIAVGVFFPIYLNTYHGIRSVDTGLTEMGKVYGLSPIALFAQVILPGAIPSILVGLRLALGTMWVTLIAAEAIASESGIGYMTSQAREFMQTDIVLVGTLLYALLGKLADVISRALEQQLLPWNRAYQLDRN